MAKAGDVKAAITKFQEASEVNPRLELDPEAEVTSILLEKAEQDLNEYRTEEAVTTLKKALDLNPNLEIANDESLNGFCWWGSLYGYAADVIDLCEQAVALNPESGGFRDSRGVARALTGDIPGAISDFQALIEWSSNESSVAARKRWISALEKGENPFTKEELDRLKEE